MASNAMRNEGDTVPTDQEHDKDKLAGKPSFAPREQHVDMTQREQERANSQRLTESGPVGADAGASKADTSSQPAVRDSHRGQ